MKNTLTTQPMTGAACIHPIPRVRARDYAAMKLDDLLSGHYGARDVFEKYEPMKLRLCPELANDMLARIVLTVK